MRRLAPRPLSAALDGALGVAEPATLLARSQSAWTEAVGDVVAAETEPATEREGVITVRCKSSLWAAELELMGADLTASLNAALGSGARSAPVSALRFVTGA